jgi:glycosyltransferase involved in cell wall biosynthesis
VSARLVGNQAAHLLGHLARPDTEVVGPVPSIVDHIADASVITCPLRIGGGIKVKVLEALHAGAAVVCSPVAAQGLADHDGALIVEDDWPRFAMAIGDLLECPDRLAAQRAAARSYARTLLRWDEATTLLGEVWRNTVAARYGNEVV